MNKTMLYKKGKVAGVNIESIKVGDDVYSACVVDKDDEDAFSVALNDGWGDYPSKATKDSHSEDTSPDDELEDKRPPSRAELEEKATELGIRFDGRTSDKKLSAKIADQLGE